MKVMLTGATGFVGRYVAEELERQDIEYVSVQRRMASDDRAIRMDLIGTNEFEALFEKFKPTHLIHTAWYAEHGKYWDSELNLQWVTLKRPPSSMLSYQPQGRCNFRCRVCSSRWVVCN